MRDRGGQCHGQRVTSRGRGVTRAEGHKQGVIREAARIAGRGGTSRGRGGHKSRRSQARVRKQRSQARVHEREAAKVMAEGYMQRQAGHKSRRLQARGHKKGGS